MGHKHNEDIIKELIIKVTNLNVNVYQNHDSELLKTNRKVPFFLLFISNQNYIRFYKLICCDFV
jgi:hypothetical protein